MNHFLSNFFSEKKSSYDQRQDDLQRARKRESDRHLGITRVQAYSLADIQRYTDGPSPFHNADKAEDFLQSFRGKGGLEALLQEASSSYGYKGTIYRLGEHPFEHPSQAGYSLDVTGSPGVSNESVGTFAGAVLRKHLPVLEWASQNEKAHLRARIFMLTESGGLHGQSLYYELGNGQGTTPLLAGGATNISGGGNTARLYLNAIMGGIQEETQQPVDIIKVTARYGDAYKELLEDLVFNHSIVQHRI